MSYYMMWVDEGNGVSIPENLQPQKEHRSWLKDGFWALVDAMVSARVLYLGSDNQSYVIVEDDAP